MNNAALRGLYAALMATEIQRLEICRRVLTRAHNRMCEFTLSEAYDAALADEIVRLKREIRRRGLPNTILSFAL